MLAVEVPLLRPALSEGGGVPHEDTDECTAARTRLAAQKDRVPRIVDRIGADRWRRLVDAPSVVERRSSIRVISRAYHKMYEILLSCALPTVARSVHLCEAPGGFAQCVGDHLVDASDWRWVALSLDAPDAPRFAAERLRTSHGHVGYCDVYDADATVGACRTLRDGTESKEEEACADLVTADGAVAMDHGAIEAEHLRLLRAECAVALRLLRAEGTLVVKFFEGLCAETRRVVAWVAHHFEHCSVIKPTASRPTNSERYLVCKRFRGPRHRVAWRDDVVAPREWDRALQTVMSRLAEDQTRHLARALSLVS